MKKYSSEKGSVMLEFVIIMPVLFVMIMAVLQLAHVWMARQVVKYAAYCAARSTLTSNQYTSHAHARRAAKQVCAWITFSESAEDLERITGKTNYSFWWDSQQIGVNESANYVARINGISVDADSDIIAKEILIDGWGHIPNSSSLDNRIRVMAGVLEPLNFVYPWETRATVEFDFPLLMPVAGKMLSFLVNQSANDLKEKLDTGEVGYHAGRGWTGQQKIIDTDKNAEKHAYPYITLKETCILPKPYSTAIYPLTSTDLDISVSGLLPGGTQ